MFLLHAVQSHTAQPAAQDGNPPGRPETADLPSAHAPVVKMLHIDIQIFWHPTAAQLHGNLIDFSDKLKMYNCKSKMILQVHDELVVEVEKSELEKVKGLVLEAMEQGQPLSVPLLVDINVGASWKES